MRRTEDTAGPNAGARMDEVDADCGPVVTELMRTPLGDFAAARAEQVRALREQGKGDHARHIGALRKPSVVLWALNQAGAVVAADLDHLRDAGERLRAAQQSVLEGDRGAAGALSQAGQEQRRAVDALTRRLGMVLTAAGHAAAVDTLRRVSDALRNASVSDDPQTWTALREGRLLEEPGPADFSALNAAGISRTSSTSKARDAAAERTRAAAAEEAARRDRIAAAEADVRRAEQVERTAAEQEGAARRRREEAAAALETARAVLAKVQGG